MSDFPQRNNATTTSRGPSKSGWLPLVIWLAGIACVWLALLPTLAELPEMQARRRLYETRGIDPSAMFYTELDATREALDRWQAFHREHPRALWIP